jgi:hypothetical protein
MPPSRLHRRGATVGGGLLDVRVDLCTLAGLWRDYLGYHCLVRGLLTSSSHALIGAYAGAGIAKAGLMLSFPRLITTWFLFFLRP